MKDCSSQEGNQETEAADSEDKAVSGRDSEAALMAVSGQDTATIQVMAAATENQDMAIIEMTEEAVSEEIETEETADQTSETLNFLFWNGRGYIVLC